MNNAFNRALSEYASK